MRSLRTTIAGLGVLLILGAGTTSVSAAPDWAPAGTAPIHPGVQVRTDVGQCTSNFVFSEGSTVYLGMAAHCAGLGSATDTDGCETDSLPLGSNVVVGGASRPGKLAYSSWFTMQQVGETDPDACAYNDFALIQLDPVDASKVNPSIPHWGGPTGVNTAGTTFGSTVYSYGNSSLRLGLTLLSPKTGVSMGDDGDGWSHNVFTVTPGVPGDSGSAFLDSSGRALGVLSTLSIVGLPGPLPGTNGVSDISRAVAYMQTHTDVDAAVVPGTEPFTPNKVPLGVSSKRSARSALRR